MVKASFVKGVVELARADPALRVVIDNPELSETMRVLDSALRITWIDFPHYHRVIEALRTRVGNAEFESFFEKLLSSQSDDPLYAPLLKTVELFGYGAPAVIRLYAQGYGLSFRDTGSMTVAALGDRAGVSLLLDHIPEPCRNLAFLHAHVGSLRGGYRLSKSSAYVEVDASSLDDGRLFFEAFEVTTKQVARRARRV